MLIVLYLLLFHGLLGAFDTLYFHELKAQLPTRYPVTSPELKLHALRDFIYVVIFGGLSFWEFHGFWAGLLLSLFLAEIAITLRDFVVENEVRKSIGGVYPGERITHALIGILYGAILALFLPILLSWWNEPSGIQFSKIDVPYFLRLSLLIMAFGTSLSGLRDILSAYCCSVAAWPWGIKKQDK